MSLRSSTPPNSAVACLAKRPYPSIVFGASPCARVIEERVQKLADGPLGGNPGAQRHFREQLCSDSMSGSFRTADGPAQLAVTPGRRVADR